MAGFSPWSFASGRNVHLGMVMIRKKRKRRNPYSWQVERLKEFAEHEREEAELYEMYYEKIGERIPLKVLEVMLFFLSAEWKKKPGSLVTVYRCSREEGVREKPFLERFEAYQRALRERRFI